MNKAVIALAFATLLSGCGAVDSMKDGFAHSNAVSETLDRSLGAKSQVGFSWNNGSLTSVNITFMSVPADKSLVEIINAAKASVTNEFKQTPEQIVVGFVVKP